MQVVLPHKKACRGLSQYQGVSLAPVLLALLSRCCGEA